MGRKTLTVHNVRVISVASKYHLKNDHRVDNVIRVLLQQRESKVSFSYYDRDVDFINLIRFVQPQCLFVAKGYCSRHVKDVEGREMYAKAC